MIRVKVHSILGLKDIIGQREIEVSLAEGSNLSNLLFQMAETWGEKLSSRLFEPGTDHLFPHIRLVVNGQDIAFLSGMETVLKNGDEVLLFPPVSGG